VIRAVGRGRTLKRSKFSEAQIAFILRQGEEGTAFGEICLKAGATYHNWRKKYGGLMPSEMKRLRPLDEENGKLKKIVADLPWRAGVRRESDRSLAGLIFLETLSSSFALEEAHRIKRRRVLTDLEVQLRRVDVAGLAGVRNYLPALDLVTMLHQ
jgi:putative transposase